MKRSMLFIPGNTPSLLINGNRLGADRVIFDLEDAVSPDEKDAARILVRNTLMTLDFTGMQTVVRINSIDTDWWQKDLQQIIPAGPDYIMLPKTGEAEDIQIADRLITELEKDREKKTALIALIETARGVENAFAIAGSSQRLEAIFLGAEDLTADLRCKRTKEGQEILYARSRLVTAARAAGKDVYDTPFTDVNDDEGMRKDALTAKALGFTGKASISPRHVDIINEVFSPSLQEINYAYEVMEAIRRGREMGRGAVSLRGKMIDAPVVARAAQTIAAAEEMGLGRGTNP